MQILSRHCVGELQVKHGRDTKWLAVGEHAEGTKVVTEAAEKEIAVANLVRQT